MKMLKIFRFNEKAAYNAITAAVQTVSNAV